VSKEVNLATENREQGGTTAERPRREERPSRPRRGGYQRRSRRKVCAFCDDKSLKIDYKNANALYNYLTDRGKILPRRATGCCARHQRELAVAIKRARHLALLPFVAEQSRRG
jgi:small subunit ribosomal protein S18